MVLILFFNLIYIAGMKEKEIEELLKFDQKLLRARLNTLRNEKFLQVRLRMETGADGKAQKVNYYFINYKSLVNVIKYKLDHMRKRMETQERDATNRASFKCTNCSKTFTGIYINNCCCFCSSHFSKWIEIALFLPISHTICFIVLIRVHFAVNSMSKCLESCRINIDRIELSTNQCKFVANTRIANSR